MPIEPANPAVADQRLLQSIEHACGIKLNQDSSGKVSARATRASLNIPQAQKLTTEALKPYSNDAVLRALERLEGMTGKPKPRSDEAEDLTMDALLTKIARYPGDIVLHVLWTWDDRHTFWPRWAELKAELDKASSLRRGILPALMNVKYEAERREPPSQEEIDRVNAIHANFLKRMGASPQKLKAPPGMLEQRVIEREAADRAAVMQELHPEAATCAD